VQAIQLFGLGLRLGCFNALDIDVRFDVIAGTIQGNLRALGRIDQVCLLAQNRYGALQPERFSGLAYRFCVGIGHALDYHKNACSVNNTKR
jgi:hypothetical protein